MTESIERKALVQQAIALLQKSEPWDGKTFNEELSKILRALVPAPSEPRVPRHFGGKTKALAMCPASCGCLWVNNGDGSMSLFGENSMSCNECEHLPWASLLPVRFDATAPSEPTMAGGGEWVMVPRGLLERVKAAEDRINAGHCIRRIPADPTDPDLVMCEVRLWLEGRDPPRWIKPAASPQPQDAATSEGEGNG